jgi:hypothetical protein
MKHLSYVMAGALAVAACAAPPADTTTQTAELAACGLGSDSSITPEVELGACPAGDASKSTVCHHPPGDPDNAHTLCVGTAAVPAHREHGDSMGSCAHEHSCDGSGDDIDAGVRIDAGHAGHDCGADRGGGSGSGSGGGSGSGSGGPPIE